MVKAFVNRKQRRYASLIRGIVFWKTEVCAEHLETALVFNVEEHIFIKTELYPLKLTGPSLS